MRVQGTVKKYGRLVLALCTGLLTPLASAEYVEMPRSEQLKAFKAAGFSDGPTDLRQGRVAGYRDCRAGVLQAGVAI